MKLDTADRMTIPAEMFSYTNLTKGDSVVFQMEGRKIYILPATNENLEKTSQKLKIKIDKKGRVAVKKILKRFDIPLEKLKDANLAVEDDKLVIIFPPKATILNQSDVSECVIRNILYMLAEEGKISTKNGQIKVTLQVTIEAI